MHDPEQERLAKASHAAQERTQGRCLHTEIETASRFYRAEDYHQKYRLRRAGQLFSELEAIYPKVDELVDSTAAARANGFVAGCGREEQLREELPTYGLSPDGERLLLKLFGHQHSRRA